MPTSAGRKPSSNNAKGQNDRPSNIGACNTASSPLNINPTDEANAPLIYAAISAKCSDDGQRLSFSPVMVRNGRLSATSSDNFIENRMGPERAIRLGKWTAG
jgi:hypothetical protein